MAPLDLSEMRRCDGIGRNILEQRINLLCDQLETARREAVIATDKTNELIERHRHLVDRVELSVAAIRQALADAGEGQ